jgi:hypothetical protein
VVACVCGQGNYHADDGDERWLSKLRALARALLTNDKTAQDEACELFLATVAAVHGVVHSAA